MCLPDGCFKSSKWLAQAMAFCIDKTFTNACLKKTKNEPRSRLRPVTAAVRLVMITMVSIQRATAADRLPRRGAISMIPKRCMQLACASCAKRFTSFSRKGKNPLAFYGDQLHAVALLPATIRRGRARWRILPPATRTKSIYSVELTKRFRLSGEVTKVSA
ncbi:expressed protein JLP1 [Toxoplasma gondii VAND]|uniref:Expressed protein JLP1 n=2 Tax=Toxoplasma gondii TaxID=5811 RepID=A0A086KIA8_TOXGO|nr:expressed protein JLP1 [Toxoplasma gondii p89]KFH08692.1 expressed protein JLP1 [Toxoplasma gondii VAND]